MSFPPALDGLHAGCIATETGSDAQSFESAISNRESEPFFDADLAYKTKSSDKELNMCTPRVKCEVVIHRPQSAVGAVVELGGWTCQ